MDKRKVIFDTDIGADDAVALTALILCDKFNLIGITTTFGNQPVNYTTDNALRLVSFLNKDIPVYKGCSHPMVRHLFNGRKQNTIQQNLLKIVDGEEITIHEKTLPLPEANRKEENQHACSYLVETLRNAKEKIIICAVGPLTNIGMALTMAPEIVDNIEAIYIMGGGIYKGNRTPTAEANFYDDPEASEIVLNCGAKIMLSPLEGCESGALYNQDDIKNIKNLNTRVGNYIAEEMSGYIKREQLLFGEWCTEDTIYDYGATIPLIDESVILEIKNDCAHVDCSGGMADGTLLLDRRGFEEINSNVYVIEKIDHDKTHQILLDLLKNAN